MYNCTTNVGSSQIGIKVYLQMHNPVGQSESENSGVNTNSWYIVLIQILRHIPKYIESEAKGCEGIVQWLGKFLQQTAEINSCAVGVRSRYGG